MSPPKLPGYTCPVIDKLKGRIEEAHRLASINTNDLTEDGLRQLLGEIAHELNGEADTLEQVRDANIALRDCAVYWRDHAERLEQTA